MRNKVGHTVGHAPEFRQIVPDYKWKLPDTHIGIEIEAEKAYNINVSALDPYWAVKDEGSIRGVSAELVLSRPLSGADLTKALTVLDDVNSKRKFPLSFSERCSVHVHLDVRDVTHEQLYGTILWYAVFERVLFKFAGATREKGVYSVPLYEAIESVKNLHGFNNINNMMHVFRSEGGNNRYKYLAINIGAIKNFGSIEFRHHPGTDNSERISTWINIIMCLKRMALNTEFAPEELPSYISAKGARWVMEQVFEEYTPDLWYKQAEEDIIKGARVAQDIVFSPQMQKMFKKAFDGLEKRDGLNLTLKFLEKHAVNAVKDDDDYDDDDGESKPVR